AIVMSVYTSLHALIAARAAIQVDEHQALSLDQAEFLEPLRLDHLVVFVPDRLTENALRPLLAQGHLFVDFLADDGRGLEQLVKDCRRHPNHLDLAGILAAAIFLRMAIGNTSGGTWLLTAQAHFADELATRAIRENTIGPDAESKSAKDPRIHGLQEKAMES